MDIERYDAPILEQLFHDLLPDLRVAPSDARLERELIRRKISVERFVGAFFRTVEPYARMMRDLCIFFERHGLKETNEKMSIIFDFGKGPQDLGFDLAHFSDWLSRWVRMVQEFQVHRWNPDTLWKLADELEYRSRRVSDSQVLRWIDRYESADQFPLRLPPVPVVGVAKIDVWLQRVWEVWKSVVVACFDAGPTRSDLQEKAGFGRDERTEDRENTQGFGIASLEGWDLQTLGTLDSDRWPSFLAKGLYGWVEEMRSRPKPTLAHYYFKTLESLGRLYESLPRETKEVRTIKAVLEELLNLPIWKTRPQLYQTWVLTQMDEALQNYIRTIRHENGKLLLSFSGTRIATIQTSRGNVVLWSELRSPLKNPVGEGRKGNIQPDYTFALEIDSSHEKALLVVETKQYLRANSRNFAAALIDYARGRPDARIILVNYGKIPDTILKKVPLGLQRRTLTIGNMRPAGLRITKEQKEFWHEISRGLPAPTEQPSEIDLIAIDISSSMRGKIERSDVQLILHHLVETYPAATLIAIDTDIRARYTTIKQGMNQLLDLDRTGGTDLQRSLSGLNLLHAIVITDEDGGKQLTKQVPSVIIIVKSSSVEEIHARGNNTPMLYDTNWQHNPDN